MHQRDKPTDPDAAEIAKLLDSITSAGHRPDEIFNDWLEMIAAALERAPAHLKSLRESPDSECVVVDERCRKRSVPTTHHRMMAVGINERWIEVKRRR